ncbi:MAG: 16S rRNA (uracil(1498)-N(3))-methyltransferase [Lachnospiraceae bacterium]|nr:16S rRNA (uracil(1498)-N(3))-methyltransferase [Lachnospiraceae bacterium]
MNHFFADPSDIRGNDIFLRGEDVSHIKNVLRLKKDDVISVSDGITDREYRCHIADFDEDLVHCRLDFVKEAGCELPVRVHLFQCLPKADKMELIIQKAVELGVYEIIPVSSKRAVVKLDEKKAVQKTARWNAISGAAAKQSRRSHIPQVLEPMDFSKAVDMAAGFDAAIIPYELASGFSRTRDIIDALSDNKDVAVFIGPEGGFDEDEIRTAKEAGIEPVSMGKRILRTETAALVFLSWLVYRFEE